MNSKMACEAEKLSLYLISYKSERKTLEVKVLDGVLTISDFPKIF